MLLIAIMILPLCYESGTQKSVLAGAPTYFE